MASTKILLLATVAVLLAFACHSNAELRSVLSKAAEDEKYVASKRFQDMQEALIMTSTDQDSLAAKAHIQAIRQLAAKCKAAGVSPKTVDTAIEGILAAVRLVSAAGRKANNAIDTAQNLAALDPVAATLAITTGVKSDVDLVFGAGVPIHDAQGSALVLAGGAAQPGLKRTIVSIQKSGTSAFEALDIAEELAILGIKAGGIAAKEAFKAAHEAVSTGGITVYTYLLKAAQEACDGLLFAASKGPINPENLAPGIIESLKTNVKVDSPAALAAVTRLSNGLKSVSSLLTKKAASDAAYIMTQGLISTILETADAIAVAKRAMVDAEKLASQDTEAAVAAVHRGIKAARDEVLSGSAGGYLGLGAAGQIAGKIATDGLIPAVIEIEYGRVGSYKNLVLAEKTATIGLRAGGIAAAQGILAAIQICEAAGNALYGRFADGGEIGFEVFQNV